MCAWIINLLLQDHGLASSLQSPRFTRQSAVEQNRFWLIPSLFALIPGYPARLWTSGRSIFAGSWCAD